METTQFKLLDPRAGLHVNTPSTASGRQSPGLSSQVQEEEERQSKEPTWRQQVCILLVHGLWGEKERKKKKKKEFLC